MNLNTPPEAPLSFKAQAPWSAWLAKNHGKSVGVWLRVAKTSTKLPSITYAEAIESALCYGWIDGQRKSDGDEYYLQRFTPRTAKSIWSKINRDKALALIERGAMKAAGLKEVERAKSDGRWERAYDSHKTSVVPDDLQAALDHNPKARAFFPTLSAQNRYAILFRIQTAKKPETRIKRIQTFVAMLERHETIHP